jgi:outer membrane biosynthesis protein TonB
MDLTRFDFERWDIWTYPLVQAFIYSLTVHIALFGTLEAGHRLGWWESTAMPSWLAAALINKLDAENEAQRANAGAISQEIPLLYVEVNPEQVSPAPPQDAKYYSTANSVAKQPDPKPPVTQAQPLQPAKAPAPQLAESLSPRKEPPSSSTPAKSPLTDLTVGTPTPEPNPPARQRPTELTQAQPKSNSAVAEAVKKAAPRITMHETTVNAIASPFGEYDAGIIAAIKKQWLFLLEQDDLVRGDNGKVVVDFRMHADGRITDLRVTENEVTDVLSIICQRAILGPAPYRPWPPVMRRALGLGYREVRFTFYYE